MATNSWNPAVSGVGARASQLNQILNALTQGQDIGPGAGLYQPIANPGAPSASVGGSGVLTGAHSYVVVWITGGMDAAGGYFPSGNTTAAGTASNTVTPSEQEVDLTAIPLGPTGVIGRAIYRTQAGGSTYYFLDTLKDNTTTTYTDNTPDSDLGAAAPTVNTTGTPWSVPVYPAYPGFNGTTGAVAGLSVGSTTAPLWWDGDHWQQVPLWTTANEWQTAQTFSAPVTLNQSLLGYDATTGTINSQIQQVDGDLWLTANALYDAATGDWNRVDTSKSAFALQIQGNTNIPGLTTPGTIIWTAAPGSNPIGAFLAEGGWVNAGIFASNQNLVVGGINLEVDGSGNAPYSRINQLQGVGTYVSRNAFYDGSAWQFDDTSLPASALALLQDGAVQVLSAPAGSTLTWSSAGMPTVVAGSKNDELTTTSATTIWSFTPPADGLYTAKVYLRVVTATTTVTVTLTYDDSGGAQTYTPAALDGASLAVGSYSMVDYSFEATASAAITLTVTAGTASQVYVTSALEGVS